MKKERSAGATPLLGMDGFVVGAQTDVDGERWLAVETTVDVVGCEGCGTRAVGHGRRVARVRDLPMADAAVVLVWSKRIWRCPEARLRDEDVERGDRYRRAEGDADQAGPGGDLSAGR